MLLIRRKLARLKKEIVTIGGMNSIFSLRILGQSLKVDYNLRSIVPDRDYQILSELAKNKKCVFDVGANHGIISLLVSKMNKGVEVHAFEASEEAVNIINHNAALNGLGESIRVVNTLVADRSGYVLPFYWEGSSGGASIVKNRLGHRKEIFKTTLALDDYVEHSNSHPDFIKMDIEGAENIAVHGMTRLLARYRPDVFVELHDFGQKKLWQNAKEILDCIEPIGYGMVYLRTGGLIDDPQVLRDRGRCHVLLIPKERYSFAFFNALDLNGL